MPSYSVELIAKRHVTIQSPCSYACDVTVDAVLEQTDPNDFLHEAEWEIGAIYEKESRHDHD